MRILVLDVSRFLGLFPFNSKGQLKWLRLLYSIILLTAILHTTIYLRNSSWWGKRFQKAQIHLYLSTTLLIVQNISFLVHLNAMRSHKSNMEAFLISCSSYKCYSCPLCLSLLLPIFQMLSAWLCFYMSKLNVFVKIIMLQVGLSHCYSYLISLQFSHLVISATLINLSIDERLIQIESFFPKRTHFDFLLVSLMNAHGVQLLYVFANSFGYLVWVVYALGNNRNEWQVKAFFLVSITVKFMSVFLPCLAVEHYLKKLDDHYSRLFNIMKDNPVLCKKASLYLYVTTKHKVSLTVCGFFTLGYPLITSIIAGCATYLVVLIQFSS